jgi:hypothetical protein
MRRIGGRMSLGGKVQERWRQEGKSYRWGKENMQPAKAY